MKKYVQISKVLAEKHMITIVFSQNGRRFKFGLQDVDVICLSEQTRGQAKKIRQETTSLSYQYQASI